MHFILVLHPVVEVSRLQLLLLFRVLSVDTAERRHLVIPHLDLRVEVVFDRQGFQRVCVTEEPLAVDAARRAVLEDLQALSVIGCPLDTFALLLSE